MSGSSREVGRRQPGERWRPILDALARVSDVLQRQPVFGWGTVVQASPLVVLLDGSVDPSGVQVPGPAQSAVGPVAVGMRVYCIEQHRRVVVISAPN